MAVRVKHVDKNMISELDHIIGSFMEQVKKEGKTYAMNGGRLDFSGKYDDLLVVRKELWRQCKDGMTKRKDLEPMIGLFAALVWWSRAKLERESERVLSEADIRREGAAKKEERDAWNAL